MSEVFFLISCFGDKFSHHIPGCHSGTCRFMATKNFVKEVRINVGILELSQLVFMEMKHFLKHLSIENSILLKALKSVNTTSSIVTCLPMAFSANLHG